MLPHWMEDTVEVPGKHGSFRVHYVRTGSGSGKPPLVLAHGFSDNGLCWKPIAQALESEWDVILPDARGHGLSQRFVPGVEVHLPDDLADFIRALGIERPVVGGHSMGGSTVGLMDARYPGLARALILEDPGWRDPRPQDASPSPHPFKDWIMGLRNQTPEQIIAGGRKNDPNWPEEEWSAWAESKLQLDPAIFEPEVAITWEPWREVVRRISAPALLITADVEKGAIVSPEMAREIQQINPRVRVAHITGSGHSIRRDDPTAFLNAVREFLKEV